MNMNEYVQAAKMFYISIFEFSPKSESNGFELFSPEHCFTFTHAQTAAHRQLWPWTASHVASQDRNFQHHYMIFEVLFSRLDCPMLQCSLAAQETMKHHVGELHSVNSTSCACRTPLG